MTNTVAQAEEYGRSHPYRDGGSWAGWCASLCWRSLENGGAPSYVNATEAGDASPIESSDSTLAPRGAFHFWGNGDGHVATDLDGGATRLMMASGTLEDVWGDHIGAVSMDYYQTHAASSVTNYYRGWSRSYGPTAYADTGAVAPAPGPDPAPPKPPDAHLLEEDTMLMAHIPKGSADGQNLFLVWTNDFYVEFVGDSAANALIRQICTTGSSAPVTRSFFDAVERNINAGRSAASSSQQSLPQSTRSALAGVLGALVVAAVFGLVLWPAILAVVLTASLLIGVSIPLIAVLLLTRGGVPADVQKPDLLGHGLEAIEPAGHGRSSAEG